MRDNQIKVNLQTFANIDQTGAWQIFSPLPGVQYKTSTVDQTN